MRKNEANTNYNTNRINKLTCKSSTSVICRNKTERTNYFYWFKEKNFRWESSYDCHKCRQSACCMLLIGCRCREKWLWRETDPASQEREQRSKKTANENEVMAQCPCLANSSISHTLGKLRMLCVFEQSVFPLHLFRCALFSFLFRFYLSFANSIFFHFAALKHACSMWARAQFFHSMRSLLLTNAHVLMCARLHAYTYSFLIYSWSCPVSWFNKCVRCIRRWKSARVRTATVKWIADITGFLRDNFCAKLKPHNV